MDPQAGLAKATQIIAYHANGDTGHATTSTRGSQPYTRRTHAMFLPADSPDDGVSVDTQDALNVVARIDFIIASLEKAGVPPEELQHLKSVISRIPQQVNPSEHRDGQDAAAGTGGDDGARVLVEGSLEKLQRGTQGFAAIWKRRWIRVSPGKLEVFESTGWPEPGTSCLFSLPLSVQQTRIDPGNEALCKKLGREAILMVASTEAVGGVLRCVTLAVKDDLALEKWIHSLQKAMSQEGHMAGASIFRASQTGDILRVKELVTRGIPVNRPNAYGCVALHYAVKNAAECATVVARGGDTAGVEASKVHAQEALRVVVFLMSHGADARAANHVGETPLGLGSRLTRGFPKSRSLLTSILDSSKYQVSGGTIFIVPGKPQPLTSLKEHEEEPNDDYDHDASTPRKPATTTAIRGVTFSPSRRNRRAQKRQDIANSHRPYAHAHAHAHAYKAAAAAAAAVHSSPGMGGSSIRNVPALPRGDHETALGGVRHRLAAGFACRNPRDREDSRRDRPIYGALSPPPRSHRHHRSAHASHPCSVAERTRDQRGGIGVGVGVGVGGGAGVGVNFTDFRMGRSSAVLVDGGGSRRTGRAGGIGPSLPPRPDSCCADIDSGRRRRRSRSAAGGGSVMERPATTSRRAERNRSNGGNANADGGSRRRTNNNNAIVVGGQQQQQQQQQHRREHQDREETRLRKRGARMARPEKRRGGGGGPSPSPSVPDSEARRQIAEWLRETAGTSPAVPPAAGHGSGEYLSETSSYVAVSRRSDVYKALQAIKGDGRGELISVDKLRTSLCRVGQPLSPEEMDDLLREADPENTGYVSCARLSKLMAGGRLKSLAKGTTYNEEDDVVLKVKARRLARMKRLAQANAVAQQATSR